MASRTVSRWMSTNRVMLINAGSLVGTTTVTSVLGFAYWWLAARQFSPAAVGFASAAISAMTLIGTACVMGLGTLLIGELPRQPGKEASLIAPALIIVSTLGVGAGIAFAVIAPLISPHFGPLEATIGDAALFAAGAGLTAITIFLDQAVIGLLRGELQFWRNVLASAIKLVALFAFGFWLWQWRDKGMAIYGTWTIGSICSLLALVIFAIVVGQFSRKWFALEWGWLRKLGTTALQHHILNLILRVPVLLLPVMVTILLSATVNAWFYVAMMMANFVFAIPLALTTVLYAINAAHVKELAYKTRQTLLLSAGICILGACALFAGATLVLGLFGHVYAEQAAWSLRILVLGIFPMIVKYHYVAIYRVYGRLSRAIPPVAIGCLLELGAADVGAHLGGLLGLSLFWVIAMYIELIYMTPVIYKVAWPGKLAIQSDQQQRDGLAVEEDITETDAEPTLKRPRLPWISLDDTSIVEIDAEPTVKLEAGMVNGDGRDQSAHTRVWLDAEPTVKLEAGVVNGDGRDQSAPTEILSNNDSVEAMDDEPTMRRDAGAINGGGRDQSAPTEVLPDDTPTVKRDARDKVGGRSVAQLVEEINKEDGNEKSAPTSVIDKEDGRDEAATTSVIDQAVIEVIDGAPTVKGDIRDKEPRLSRFFKTVGLLDIITVLLPLGSFVLWLVSLQYVNVGRMNDLGLVSVMPPSTIIALIIMMISFCLALRKPRAPIMILHLLLLIFMLYGMTTLVEQAPRFSVLYRHAGYTEYIMRTGTVDPGLDAYFNWPGFFVLAAFVTKISGYSSILGYAVWAPVFLNLLYMGPMYLIFTSATNEKRTVWLALWLFCLTNWIGQDYFSPQGFNFFLYLVIIAILLRWFRLPNSQAGWARASLRRQRKRPDFLRWMDGPPRRKVDKRRSGRFIAPILAWLRAPDTGVINQATTGESISAGKRTALLVVILLVFALSVFSHPLTPFFIIMSVAALVVFRRCSPWWLPVAMAAMTGAWILLMAQPFLVGHLDWVTGGLGAIEKAFSANVSSRVTGSPQHSLIVKIGLLTTAAIWGLAALGALYRLIRGYHDLSLMLLAIAPFSLLAADPYGGEMLLRIYLFVLPPVVFFAASLPYSRTILRSSARVEKPSLTGEAKPSPLLRRRAWVGGAKPSPLLTGAVAAGVIVLLVGFLFTRYGNERQDYMTYNEVNGVRYLYSIAPPNSTFIEGWDGAPWQFQDFEKYNTYSLTDVLPDAVPDANVNAIIQFIKSKEHAHTQTYMLFTRSQKATAEMTSGLPPGALDNLENAMLASGHFRLVYSNPDAQILLYIGG
jgi:O-antigen/teichoic acid export membrane protein